jgi:phosphoribosyl 1,2-cyclic phosphate phosphodiesterase
MTIKILGSGAADGIPAFYSDSEVSRYAREHGGKDIRTRSAALIDGHLKIDLPPDTLTQLNREKLDARDWSALIFTHGHEDHFALEEIQYGLYPFNSQDHLSYTIFANDWVCDRIESRYPDWPIEVHRTQSFRPFTHADYTITPLAAFHDSSQDCQNLVFQKDGATLLYATDTGVWREPTWDALSKFRLDALVIECTDGFVDSDYEGHLDLVDLGKVLDRLRKSGCVHDQTQIVTTHHSHLGGGTHSQLLEALRPLGAEPAYDGMEIVIPSR